MDQDKLITAASYRLMVRLSFVEAMTDDCILVTDSGSTKLYVIGLLDNGRLFVERAEPLEETYGS
jgi:hypothetical protein